MLKKKEITNLKYYCTERELEWVKKLKYSSKQINKLQKQNKALKLKIEHIAKNDIYRSKYKISKKYNKHN